MFPISEYWRHLSPQLKRRWWNETRYGKLEPNLELRTAILAETSARGTECEKSTTVEGGGAEGEKSK
jgi:hypothetical protein